MTLFPDIVLVTQPRNKVPDLQPRGKNIRDGNSRNGEESSQDRLPPYAMESERGILACCFMDPRECVPLCIEKLRDGPKTFYDLKHQYIFQFMVQMFDASEEIDVITLSQRLKDKGLLEQIGGINYLSQLPEAAPSAANLEYYLGIVSEKYLARRMISVCTEAVGKVYDAEGEVNSLLDEVERDVLRIRESTVTTQMVPIVRLVSEFQTRYEEAGNSNGRLTGLATGFIDLDRITSGLQPGEMFVLAARPSLGKTSLALNIADFVAVELKLPVQVFSLEMTAAKLTDRLVLSRARVNIRSVQDGFKSKIDDEKVFISGNKIASAPIFIDDTSSLSILQLRARARRYYQQYGIKLFVIDYLQLMNAIGGGRRLENRQQEISDISAGVKSLAKELNVPVLLLAQLNRNVERDKNRKPRCSDLRESGAIEQDADVVGLLYKPGKGDNDDDDSDKEAIGVNLLIDKNRNGPTGELSLTFLKAYTKFENASKLSGDDIPEVVNQQEAMQL